MTKVEVFDKYTVCLPDAPDEHLLALRYGKEWRDCTGDNLILALAAELHNAREEVERLQEELADAWDDGYKVGKYNDDNKTPHYPVERKSVFVMSAIARGEQTA